MYSRLRRDLIVPLRFVRPAGFEPYARDVSFWPRAEVFGDATIPSAIWGATDPPSRAAPTNFCAQAPLPPPGGGEPQVFLLLGRKLLRVRRPMPGARFFARSAYAPQDGASPSRCLTCYPRGASRARYDPYEVNLPVVPAGTPSAYAEALSWPIKQRHDPPVATRTRCRAARWRGE
jgi:hypothetical protein